MGGKETKDQNEQADPHGAVSFHHYPTHQKQLAASLRRSKVKNDSACDGGQQRLGRVAELAV